MKPRRRIYIAGPMRGLPQHNFPAFNDAAFRFRMLGWSVDNPVEIGEALSKNDPNVPGGEYLRADVRAIADCTAIALLPGWERSTGARCEVALAITIGLAFYDAVTALPRLAPERVTICGGYERPAGAVESLDTLLSEVQSWANAQFGGRERQAGKIAHLSDEVAELAASPFDEEEMADIFILLAHIADGVDLASRVREKLERNKRRVWGTEDERGVIRHVDSPRAPLASAPGVSPQEGR